MSTKQEKQPHVLTAENGLFYGADKVMTNFGDKLKVYANLGSAQAAARMLAKNDNVLTPVALQDAKNGTDKARNDETTQTVPLPSAEAALREKEAREFSEMLVSTYGHITTDKAKQEALHLFTLSPAYTRISFSLEWLEGIIGEYRKFVEDIPTPANKQILLDKIKAEQSKLETFKTTFVDDPETLDYVSIGVKAKLAPLQAELASLPNENELAFTGLVVHPIACKFLSEKARQPSTRKGKNGNGNAWVMGDGQFLAFDLSSTRVCQNGVDLSKLNIQSIQGFVYHPNHENVKNLTVPADKLAIVDVNHTLIATTDAKQALGNVLGEAVYQIVQPAIEKAKFVQAISSTGVDAFKSKKAILLSKTARPVTAGIIRNGKHGELETAGSNGDTEKDHAPVE